GRTDEAPALRVEAARAKEAPDRLRLAPPRRAPVGNEAPVGQVGGALERDHAHALRLRVVALCAAQLPDAGVGVAPARGDEVRELGRLPPGVAVDPARAERVAVDRVDHVAVDVELALRRGGV